MYSTHLYTKYKFSLHTRETFNDLLALQHEMAHTANVLLNNSNCQELGVSKHTVTKHSQYLLLTVVEMKLVLITIHFGLLNCYISEELQGNNSFQNFSC